MTTSQPSSDSTRAVAALTCGKNSPCTQPVSIPTTALRSPLARTTRGRRWRCSTRGASAAMAPRLGFARPRKGAIRSASHIPGRSSRSLRG